MMVNHVSHPHNHHVWFLFTICFFFMKTIIKKKKKKRRSFSLFICYTSPTLASLWTLKLTKSERWALFAYHSVWKTRESRWEPPMSTSTSGRNPKPSSSWRGLAHGLVTVVKTGCNILTVRWWGLLLLEWWTVYHAGRCISGAILSREKKQCLRRLKSAWVGSKKKWLLEGGDLIDRQAVAVVGGGGGVRW